MTKKAGIMMLGAVLLASFTINIQAARPTVKISASPTSIVVGSSSILTWTSTGATSASINQGIGSVAVNGSRVVSPTATTTYTISAKNSSGTTTATATVTVKATPPTVAFSAAPVTIPPGGSATLSWTTTNATSASIDQNIGTVALNGSKIVKPTTTKTYTITVKGSGGTVTATAKVTVVIPPPTVSFSAAPDTITPGGSATLSWTTTGATSASIDQNIGTVALNGSKVVKPTTTKIYTITVKGSGGTVTAKATVTVAAVKPTVTISAEPITIQPGEESILTWTSTNATSATIDNGIGSVSTVGSTTVYPEISTTYTIIVSGSGGTASASATVTVNQPQPQVNLKAIPTAILPGKSSTLCWQTKNVDSTTIDNGVGDVPTNGSIQVSPAATTTYTITATGPGGTTNATVTVSIDDMLQPSVSIYSSLEIVASGKEIVLSWNAMHAESTSIDNGIGSVQAKGSLRVTPGQSTTYTITAENRNGAATASVKVELKSSPRCYAYIPNNSDHTVSVVNTAYSGSVVKTIPVGEYPSGCAVAKDGMRVYIGSSQGISVIDTGSNSVDSTIEVSGIYGCLALHPGGRWLYAPAWRNDCPAIVVFDTITGREVKEINLGDIDAQIIVFHPDGSRLYAAGWSLGKVLVIDTISNEIMFTIQVPSSIPTDLAISHDGSRLYVIGGAYQGDNVFVIDLLTNSVIYSTAVRQTQTGQTSLLFAGKVLPDDSKLYVTADEDVQWKRLSYINTSTFGEKKAEILYLYSPKSLAVHPDGSRVFIVGYWGQGGYMEIFSTSSNASVGGVALGQGSVAKGNFVGYMADTVAGKVTQNNVGVEGVTLTISAAGVTQTALTDASGNYIAALKNGTYTITPSKDNMVFSPQNQQVTINWSVSGKNFKVIDTSVPPTVSLKASPVTINIGSSATLTWTSTNAVTVTIDNDIGEMPENGSISVTPSATTTYKITVSNTVLTASATVIVYVYGAIPTVSITAAPATINSGESSTLTWTSTSAASASIDNGIGTVPVNGSKVVTPSATTTYKITVTGPGGTANASVPVTINNPYSSVLTGTVTDFSSNQPITAVLVTALDSASQSKTTQTDVAGKYSISSLAPGNVQVSFAKSGYNPYQQTINIPANTTIELITQLRLTLVGATLTGLVKDGQTTQPISGAAVTAVFSGSSLTATSGSDGAYALVGIPLNTPVKITAAAVGYHDVIINQTFTMNAGFVYDFILYKTSVLATVNGKITNSKTLLPEAGVKVTREGSNIEVTTAADGTFVFADIPFGEQIFYLEKDDFINEVMYFTIDRTPFTIDLIKPNSEGGKITVGQNISGLIQDSLSQRPIAGAKVRVPGLNLEALSDANGNYSLTDLPIGNYPLIILAVNHQAMNFMVSVVFGETNKADFALFPLAKGLISGVITDFVTGQPVAEASIAIDGSGLLAATSEGDGTYKMVGVPPGTYKIMISHAEYNETFVENVTVFDLSPATVNLQLNKRPQTGALEGKVLDINTSNPVSGATVEVTGTAISAMTDAEGKYRLTNVPAGLNNLTVSASGYPSSPRIRAVIADETPTSSSTTVSNIIIDPANSTVNEAVTKLIKANEGGDIISQDSRFLLHIFPDTLSADANITLNEVTDKPNNPLGSGLLLDRDLDPLGITEVKAASVMTKVQIAAVNGTDPAPTINGLAALAMRYSQKDADDFQLDENSAFSFFWNGSSFSILNPRPYELAVDKTNNIFYAVLDFSATVTDGAVPFVQSGLSRSGSMPGVTATDTSLAERIFILGQVAKNILSYRPSVKIFDKNELDAVTTAPFKNIPNPNALPLLFIHGFDPLDTAIALGTNPNKGDRYPLMLQDIVEATNGVYRPVFVAYNTKAKIDAIGSNLAEKIFGEYLNKKNMIQGLPAFPDKPDSGNFPYLDTFGFSMGGLVARSFLNKSNLNMVHNMIMLATPNHGTISLLKYLSYIPSFWSSLIGLKLLNPGAADMWDYDDSSSVGKLQNPFLYTLNSPINSRAVMPRGDMTLFAGNDKTGYGIPGAFLNTLLDSPNDSLVPVRSVYCRPTGSTYESKLSLLKTNEPRAKKIEIDPKDFSHAKVGKFWQRISEFSNEIARGLSDWVVERAYNENPLDNAFLPPYITWMGYVKSKTKVEYNVWDGSDNRTARDFDRVVLVIYHKDGNGHWHISPPLGGENGADTNGNVIQAKVMSIQGNSQFTQAGNPLILSANVNFDLASPPDMLGYDPEKWIVEVAPLVFRLEPGKMTVPLDPTKARFRIPDLNE